ncbi:MAG TPA: transketolase [Steroidobacter sp.]|jgi:transketolase|nr:transketolase [Steroidobacteraceae bacterium]HLS82363.1 transketolase [Steroidobacter sp.]
MNERTTLELRRRKADALRMLAIDAVEAANSGHPGAPMGLAEVAEALWCNYLKHDPAHPEWPDRDRFVLSNGHASMLLYGLLHLTGYDLPIGELQRFRQLHSRTPGHPEVGVTPGVETTTGPLGQGLANAVGMALAEKLLAHRYNRPECEIVAHHTYVILGDGCLMEGVSHEACSLAGVLRLSKLIALYDDNGISIDGPVDDWFLDDTPARFRAYGWRVIEQVDGHDSEAVAAAIALAVQQSGAANGRPTLICCKTTIGKGSPGKCGSHDVHGAPLGQQECAATRESLGWTHPPFVVPEDLRAAWDCRARGAEQYREWLARMSRYRERFPELADEFERRMKGDLPADFPGAVARAASEIIAGSGAMATRKASQKVLDLVAPALVEIFGGSADLTGSNLTEFRGCVRARRDSAGNHLSYGVREFGMAAVMNGMSLHGGFIPYGGTFLTFSDYSRNAVRMAALMKQRVIHVFTHDSIGLGEDGPTHQAVEQAPSLRLIPNLDVWRPADALETLAAWESAIARRGGPTALLLSRQNVASIPRSAGDLDLIRRGGYVLRDPAAARATLLATGSELGLVLEAQQLLAARGVAVRVVSMPCTNQFDRQEGAYRDSVLPRYLPIIAVEAAQPDLWRKYVGRAGAVIGVADFGASAPGATLYEHFGITPHAIAACALQMIGASEASAQEAACA